MKTFSTSRKEPSRAALLTRGACALAAMASLVAAMWGGLARMGLPVAFQPPGWLTDAHGPLMLNGFFGTVISLERAVAYDRMRGYLPPFLTALGVVVTTFGGGVVGPWLVVAGSLGLVALFVAFTLRQAVLHHAIMGAAAVAWAISNILWAVDWQIFDLVGFWSLFLVWTIAGERLELSRVLGRGRRQVTTLLLLFGAAVGGLVATSIGWPRGTRLLGVSFAGLAVWLVLFDVARRTARAQGLTGYIGAVLLSGYAWLGIGGSLLAIFGNPQIGPIYGAAWHSVLVGFVLTMIFAHAPVILPAITSRRVDFHRALYAPAVLLHLSLIVRVVGALASLPNLRLLGGAGNVASVILFAGVMAWRVEK